MPDIRDRFICRHCGERLIFTGWGWGELETPELVYCDDGTGLDCNAQRHEPADRECALCHQEIDLDTDGDYCGRCDAEERERDRRIEHAEAILSGEL